MSFTIPNEADAGFADQAEPDARDFSDILVPGLDATLVIGGCAVTAQGSPDMTVAVAAGMVRVAGTSVAVAAGNVTITAADGTNPRFDLVCVASSGTKSAVAGTAAANPVFPDPAGKVVLAAVYVPASDTAINTNQIIDKRVPAGPGTELAYAEITSTATSTQTVQASATTWITAPSVTFDGSTIALVDVYLARLANSVVNGQSIINLWEDSTDLGIIARTIHAAAGDGVTIFGQRRLTPGSGAKVYTVRAWVAAASTATALAGSGTGGASMPSFVRITKV